MQFYVTYDIESGDVLGYLRTTSPVKPRPRSDQEEFLPVSTEADIALLSRFSPGTHRLRGQVQDGVLHKLKTEPVAQGRIVLTSDGRDLDGDGVPELPADGKSVVTITAQVVDHDGQPLAREGLRIDFRVTRGVLSARRDVLRDGRAEVRLRAIEETITTEMTASAEGLSDGLLRLELIPPDEYQALIGTSAA